MIIAFGIVLNMKYRAIRDDKSKSISKWTRGGRKCPITSAHKQNDQFYSTWCAGWMTVNAYESLLFFTPLRKSSPETWQRKFLQTYAKKGILQYSSTDVKIKILVLIRLLKSSILSSTSFQTDQTFCGVGSAAVEQYRHKANMVAPADGKFGAEANPRNLSNQKKMPCLLL